MLVKLATFKALNFDLKSSGKFITTYPAAQPLPSLCALTAKRSMMGHRKTSNVQRVSLRGKYLSDSEIRYVPEDKFKSQRGN